jgi:hypothetical protein
MASPARRPSGVGGHDGDQLHCFAALGGDYLDWYVRNGFIIALVFSVVAVAVDLDRQVELIAAHPLPSAEHRPAPPWHRKTCSSRWSMKMGSRLSWKSARKRERLRGGLRMRTGWRGRTGSHSRSPLLPGPSLSLRHRGGAPLGPISSHLVATLAPTTTAPVCRWGLADSFLAGWGRRPAHWLRRLASATGKRIRLGPTAVGTGTVLSAGSSRFQFGFRSPERSLENCHR